MATCSCCGPASIEQVIDADQEANEFIYICEIHIDLSSQVHFATWLRRLGVAAAPPQPDIRRAHKKGLDLADRITEGMAAREGEDPLAGLQPGPAGRRSVRSAQEPRNSSEISH